MLFSGSFSKTTELNSQTNIVDNDILKESIDTNHHEVQDLKRKDCNFTYKKSPYPPGNRFSRALESRFQVPKMKPSAQISVQWALSLEIWAILSQI